MTAIQASFTTGLTTLTPYLVAAFVAVLIPTIGLKAVVRIVRGGLGKLANAFH